MVSFPTKRNIRTLSQKRLMDKYLKGIMSKRLSHMLRFKKITGKSWLKTIKKHASPHMVSKKHASYGGKHIHNRRCTHGNHGIHL